MKKEESYALKYVHHSHLKTRSGTKSMNRKNHNLVEWTHSEKAVGRMKKKKSVHTLTILESLWTLVPCILLKTKLVKVVFCLKYLDLNTR